MTLPDPILNRTKAWLKLALDDLQVAKTLIEGPHISHRNSAFHAQQAAEKALKGLLVFRQREIPYTHNLLTLIELLEEPAFTPELIRQAAALSPHATSTR